MAFNFNWKPLVGSTSSPEFYIHAKQLLTSALNKSAKPSVVVDSEITVEDLNLGQKAPELEVLEIGDLAEDRFQGVFRMTYDGDAFLTLRTKVQINPLNTYVRTTATYTSLCPLAASSPLTMPVKLTLSEFKLSGFVILVFSKAKGMTLVFRNDPVESMRVQSTFDSVPFIKDYLQQEIERQVRELFQEELPLSVYRLSLRLLDPENRDPPGDLLTPESLTPGEDNIDDDSFIDPIYNSSDNADIPPRFSEHSMLRLHALVNSQKTLSPITPAISGAISRATPPCVIQADSNSDRISHLDSSDTLSAIGLVTHSDHAGPRPCLHSSTSSAYSVGSNGCQQPIARRKKKHRVVNLRRGRNISSLSSETSSSCDDSTTKITSTASEPESGSASACQSSSLDAIRPKEFPLVDTNPILSIPTPIRLYSETPPNPLRLGQPHRPPLPIHRDRRPPHLMPSSGINLGSTNTINLQEHGLQEPNGIRPRGIVEKAFMMKFMAEIQKQAEEQRDRLI